MRGEAPPDVSRVLIEGPWQHRMVAANGARFHLAVAGTGPTVLLLHGFGQFWWAWRHQLTGLAEAGYRVVAMDLRGYGASDKPPRGYDTATLCADVAGIIRALGEQDAVIVGHDWGAWIAWSMPAVQPRQTRAIAAFSMPHPLVLYRELALARSPRTTARVIGLQVPWAPQRRLVQEGGMRKLITSWWGEGTPDPAMIQTYADAVRLPSVAAASLNSHRWAVRGGARREARAYREALETPIEVPVLSVHGGRDTWIRRRAMAASHHYVRGPYRARLLPGAGHLVPEEAPAATTRLLLEWLATLDLPNRQEPRSLSINEMRDGTDADNTDPDGTSSVDASGIDANGAPSGADAAPGRDLLPS